MFLVFSAVALPPFIFADPHDHAAWGGKAYNLAAVAAAWTCAEALAIRGSRFRISKARSLRWPKVCKWTAYADLIHRLTPASLTGH